MPRGRTAPLTGYEKALAVHLVGSGMTLAKAAKIVGRAESSIYRVAKAAEVIAPSRVKHRWSDEEDTYIRTALDQAFSYSHIARILRRPLRAVRHRAYDLGLAAGASSYAVHRLADMLGVNEKAVSNWIKLGLIRAHNNGTRTLKHNLISEEAVYDFLDRESSWHLWDAPTIADGVLREYAMQLREGKHWLTLPEVGKLLGYTREGLRPYVHKGFVRIAVRPRKGGTTFLIREDWIPAAREAIANGGPCWWGPDILDKPIWLSSSL